MIDAVVRGMLGSLSPVLDFLLEHQILVSSVFLVWLIVYGAGRYQLRRIRQRTIQLVVELGRKYVADNPRITSKTIYRRAYARWAESLPRWAWFVPHRLDLWPVPVNADTVSHKFSFSPEWVAEVLRRHDVPLREFEERTDG
jgi:hypothetical protein